MALSNRVNIRGGSSEPTYITTGLSITDNRVSINSGGYYVKNGFVYVNIDITITKSVSNTNFSLIEGFPLPSTTQAGNLTPTVDNTYMYYNANSQLALLLSANSIVAGQTRHFEGSYQARS